MYNDMEGGKHAGSNLSFMLEIDLLLIITYYYMGIAKLRVSCCTSKYFSWIFFYGQDCMDFTLPASGLTR